MIRFNLPVSVLAVTRTSCDPTCRGTSPRFFGMFCPVTPRTKALEIVQRVIHVIAVFMVDVALPSFATPFARALRLQALRCTRSAVPGLRLAFRIRSLRESLAHPAAVSEQFEAMALTRSSLCVSRVLAFWTEQAAANRAGLQRVDNHKNAVIIVLKPTVWIPAL